MCIRDSCITKHYKQYGSDIPVSYTHLDVYKRQELILMGVRENKNLGMKIRQTG